MVKLDQGPGSNITFFLISTTLNLDPDKGSLARSHYDYIKSVIIQRAEIIFEHFTIRRLINVDISLFLQAFNITPRTLYQALFGVTEHSNDWTIESLRESIDSTPFPRSPSPEDGHFSIDFFQSQEDSMVLNRDVDGSWIEQREFFFSFKLPSLQDGKSGDLWLVSSGSSVDDATNDLDIVEIWYKPTFEWVKLEDFVKKLNPVGEVFYQNVDPGNGVNRWWLDTTGFNVRRYNDNDNSWDSFTSVIFQLTQPVGLDDGDLWVKVANGKFELSELVINKFIKRTFSPFTVQDRNTNTIFCGTFGNNNFIVNFDDDALRGEPFSGDSSVIQVFDENVFVGTFKSLNFIGDKTLDPSISIPDCLDVSFANTFRESFTSSDLTSNLKTINHNLEVLHVMVQIFDENDQLIQPDNISLLNINQCEIDLSTFETIQGTWTVITKK